jgi:hypothetical protein
MRSTVEVVLTSAWSFSAAAVERDSWIAESSALNATIMEMIIAALRSSIA